MCSLYLHITHRVSTLFSFNVDIVLIIIIIERILTRSEKMKARVICFLPSHHEEYVSVYPEYVFCGDGSHYEIAEDGVDLDELIEWNRGETMDKLMVTILVDIEQFCFEAKYYGEINNGNLRQNIEELEIIDVSVTGMLADFYDVDVDNTDAEAYLIKLLESR